jgi:hypothetical protein
MQQQQHAPLVIGPTPGNLRFRRGYSWVIFLSIGMLGLVASFAWSRGASPVAFLLLGEMFFMVGLLWWFKQQGKKRRLTAEGEAVARPAYYLTEEGLTIVGSPTYGPIPWSEIRVIRDTHFLGIPVLKLEGDFGRIRRRLGKQGRFLCLAWMPGGIGLNAVPFQKKGISLAGQINAYRDSLAPLPDRLAPLSDDPT